MICANSAGLVNRQKARPMSEVYRTKESRLNRFNTHIQTVVQARNTQKHSRTVHTHVRETKLIEVDGWARGPCLEKVQHNSAKVMAVKSKGGVNTQKNVCNYCCVPFHKPQLSSVFPSRFSFRVQRSSSWAKVRHRPCTIQGCS